MEFDKLSPVQIALLESVLDYYSFVPEEGSIDHSFSLRFQKWVKRAIKRENHRKDGNRKKEKNGKTMRLTKRSIRRAIMIAALIALLITSVIAVGYIKKVMIKFSLENQGENFIISFDPEAVATAPRGVYTYYIPSKIPEGFMVMAEEKSLAGVDIAWTNEESEIIFYDQSALPKDVDDTNWMGINAEGAKLETGVINGYEVQIVHDQYCCTVVWTDNSYVYTIQISNTIDFSVITQMIESMTVVE